MKPKRLTIFSAAIVLTMVLGAAACFITKQHAASIEPLPESEVETTMTDHGTTYKLCHGNLYRVNTGTGKWQFVQQFYEPDYFAKNYAERDGTIFRKVGNGELVPVKRSFAEDFEDTRRLADLLSLKRGWTSCELQSPKAPTVKEYVKLRNRILKGESDFLDNRIEPTGEVVHGGKTALKTVSMPPSRGMVTAKSSLSTELLHFVKGDDVWVSIWCYVPTGSGVPFTVLDLETTWISQQPGLRIAISDGKYACFQLKWAGSAYYRQPKGKEVTFPLGQWVNLKAHLKLSEKDDGVIQLWQDGQKIIDSRGQTLVLAHAIYNSLEIGLSAYNEKDKTATLYMDDVSISDQPMKESPVSMQPTKL
ncbi:MAG: heparin lyase I family protein [Limisphaerales bacterium]